MKLKKIGILLFLIISLILSSCRFFNRQNTNDPVDLQFVGEEITIYNKDFRHIDFLLSTDDIKISDSVSILKEGGDFVELNQELMRCPVYWLKSGMEYEIVGYNPKNQWIKFHCPDPIANNEVNFFRWLDSCRYDSIPLTNYFSSVEAIYLKKDSLAIRGRESCIRNYELLKQYALAHPVSEQFISLCERWFKLNYCRGKMMSFYRAMRLEDTVKSEMYKKLLWADSVLFDNDSLLFTYVYGNEVWAYNAFLTSVKWNRNKCSLAEQYDIAKTFFKGQTRDYVLFNLYRAMLNTKDTCLNRIDFFSDCSTEVYKKAVKEKLEYEGKVNKYDSKHFIALDGQVVSWRDLLKKWQGKIVYIDCWGAGCAPCRALLPSSHALAKEYAGQGVVFAYLSIDTDVSYWRKACEVEKLTGQVESYCILHPKEFLKTWSIPSIPHYILLDREGNVINKQCLRPNDPELKELLDSVVR